MQLIILHHHLNRGGVTSVIENHLRSLATLNEQQRPTRVTIAYGGRDAAWNDQLADELPFECTLAIVPELEYDNFQAGSGNLYEAVQAVLQQCERATTVLHIHNHSLGKNAQMANVVCRLADEGWRLLLQIHDFAEDLRPQNYQHLIQRAASLEQMRAELYPQAEQVHYCVLNQRDRQVLANSAVAEARLHLLPNPVEITGKLPNADQIARVKAELTSALGIASDQQLVLYPVRPIRRKNIGELLLWSLLAEGATFALTLAPLNPVEQVAYQRWVDFAKALALPVRFEIATQTELEFAEVYSAADAIITTSVAEGFGLVYLEAALAHKQLVGRKLTSVCQDFEAAGMEFPGLTESLDIPTQEIDVDALRQTYADRIEQLRQEYQLASDSTYCDEAGDDSLFSGATIDFARLESSQQREFLQRVQSEAALRETLRDLNPTVATLKTEPLAEVLERNCHVIAENYSPQVLGRRLYDIYESLLACQARDVVRDSGIAESVLRSFVHPQQLFPLRLES